MIRKALHISVIAILALNLMGVWAFAGAFDCGMECCRVSETAKAGIPTFESPSCCSIDDVTCGFEAAGYDELFDEVLCCHSPSSSASIDLFLADDLSVAESGENLPGPTTLVDLQQAQPPPIYIQNLSLIC